uniref:Ig-like domain-containing protein n=1 Tax=Oreochromis niloticus TaxID=8128 RepID=A0A669CLB3_ORENI
KPKNLLPTLTVLPPAKEEDKQSSATLVCLATGGFPSNWKLGWKVGGTSTSSGVSTSLEVLGTDSRYSWSSTLSLSADQWRKAGSVSCEASLSGQSPVTQTLDPDHCSEDVLYFAALHSPLLVALDRATVSASPQSPGSWTFTKLKAVRQQGLFMRHFSCFHF